MIAPPFIPTLALGRAAGARRCRGLSGAAGGGGFSAAPLSRFAPREGVGQRGSWLWGPDPWPPSASPCGPAASSAEPLPGGAASHSNGSGDHGRRVSSGRGGPAFFPPRSLGRIPPGPSLSARPPPRPRFGRFFRGMGYGDGFRCKCSRGKNRARKKKNHVFLRENLYSAHPLFPLSPARPLHIGVALPFELITFSCLLL